MTLISGVVVHGRQLGRTIGFPTANLRLDTDVPVTDGVYAAWADRDNGESYPAAASIGRRPTVEADGERLLEVHLLGSSNWLDLYDENLTVRLVQSVRGERRFADIDALKAQIKDDCVRVLEILK